MTEPGGRLAEIIVALSLATDLGTGQPMEQGVRTCWVALRTAEALGLDEAERSSVFYVTLLRFVGCTADASDTAVLVGGDDIAFNASMAPMLMGSTGDAVRHFVKHLAEDEPLPRRVRRIARALTDPGADRRSLSQHCEAAARLAGRMHLDAGTCDALGHAYERWDGKGYPDGLAEEAVPSPIRIAAAARDAEMWCRLEDWDTAADVLRRRQGRGHDPAVVHALLAHGAGWLAELGDDPLAQLLDAEPTPVRTVGPGELDDILGAVADFTDMKSRFFRGHSSGVARLADAAAKALGSAEPDVVRRAALVHDVGIVGVPSGIWDRAGALTRDEWERVRLHPYLTERVLQRAPALATYAAIAGRHHERADGSGYHRGDRADQVTVAARLLAAADAFQAMVEERPHRRALGRDEAAAALLDDVDNGLFTRAEAHAVIDAAGESRRPTQIARPAGLTEREVDVLRLLARGHSNKAIASSLGISPKTVGHHVEHIYAKTAVTTRAGATLFAMENALLS